MYFSVVAPDGMRFSLDVRMGTLSSCEDSIRKSLSRLHPPSNNNKSPTSSALQLQPSLSIPPPLREMYTFWKTDDETHTRRVCTLSWDKDLESVQGVLRGDVMIVTFRKTSDPISPYDEIDADEDDEDVEVEENEGNDTIRFEESVNVPSACVKSVEGVANEHVSYQRPFSSVYLAEASKLQTLQEERDYAVELAKVYSKEIDEMQKFMFALQSSVEELKMERDEVMRVARTATDEVFALKSSLEIVGRDLTEERQQNAALRKEVSGLKQELVESAVSLETLRYEWNKVRARVDTLNQSGVSVLSPISSPRKYT
eukprot:PhF_6_TR31407/c0_g1_i2/m.46030